MKGNATRTARGTKGRKKKLEVSGNVANIATPATATASAKSGQ